MGHCNLCTTPFSAAMCRCLLRFNLVWTALTWLRTKLHFLLVPWRMIAMEGGPIEHKMSERLR